MSKIIVGIPSLNEQNTIANVTRQVDIGLQTAFPDYDSLIVNVDSDSDDHTRKEFIETSTTTKKLYLNTGRHGKGTNLFKLLELGEAEGAKVVCTVDADLLSIDPIWMQTMISPILDGRADYVLPIYARGRFDGNITNHLCYPMLTVFYGVPVRQPIAGDFALGLGLVKTINGLSKPPQALHYGVDIFMTVCALSGGFRTEEVFLGRKIHKPGFGNMIPITQQVSATLFELLFQDSISSRNSNPSYKQLESSRSSLDPVITRPAPEAIEERRRLALDYLKEVTQDRSSLLYEINNQYKDIYEQRGTINLDSWCEYLSLVFQKVVQENRNTLNFEKLGHDFTPIFLLRALSYFVEVESLSVEEVEALINSQIMKIKIK